MILGKLRIATELALPFAREKLRAALILAGLQRVMVSQLVGIISQEIRHHLPVDLHIGLDPVTGDIVLSPAQLAGRYHRLPLRTALDEHTCQKMRGVLARLTREELLYDLEKQVEERTFELNIEREKSERLLQNMLPASIAKRLKNGEVIADRHEASVIFVDIVGFTKWAAHLNAAHLVEYLDLIFGEFDAITRRHGLEKIKTIGDCYMAASGLPEPQADHVERAVKTGLDIIQNMGNVREQLKAEIDVRVGIHCGPLIAGVIGELKPFYDIWGDAVNIASRMESHGSPGRLHVSDDVRQALDGNYLFEERGVIDIKNRGQMKTWFINGTTA